MKEFKIRSSQIGKIMGIKALGKTGESYCQEWLKEQLYNRKKEFSNKYTDKGITVEDNALDYIAENLDYGMLLKNDKYFENDFITGTPDAILKDHIIDVKSSWDCFTFPLFEEELPNKDYYWQAQGYMDLVGIDKFKLIYVLMDTPVHIIEKEFNYNNALELDYDEFEKKYKYSDVESNLRIKVFEINRNDEDIKKIYARVKECRDYINSLSEDKN